MARTWVNDGSLPLSADNLNAIESDIAAAAATANQAKTGLATKADLVSGKVPTSQLPTYAAVATTGAYSDLSGTPTIPSPTTSASALTTGTLADARLSSTAQGQLAKADQAMAALTSLDAEPLHFTALEMGVITGTWTTVVVGTSRTPKTIADGQTGKVGRTLHLPSSWTQVNVKVIWTVPDGTAGNVYLQAWTGEFDNGDVLGAGSAGTAQTPAAPGTANKKATTDLGNFTVTGKDEFQVHVLADRANAADTYTGALSILGLKITRVA